MEILFRFCPRHIIDNIGRYVLITFRSLHIFVFPKKEIEEIQAIYNVNAMLELHILKL